MMAACRTVVALMAIAAIVTVAAADDEDSGTGCELVAPEFYAGCAACGDNIDCINCHISASAFQSQDFANLCPITTLDKCQRGVKLAFPPNVANYLGMCQNCNGNFRCYTCVIGSAFTRNVDVAARCSRVVNDNQAECLLEIYAVAMQNPNLHNQLNYVDRCLECKGDPCGDCVAFAYARQNPDNGDHCKALDG